jgi:hypothetical protein
MFKIKGKKLQSEKPSTVDEAFMKLTTGCSFTFSVSSVFFWWQSFLFDPMESVRCKAVMIILIGRYGLDDHLNEFQWIFAGMIWTNGKGDGRLHVFVGSTCIMSCQFDTVQWLKFGANNFDGSYLGSPT